MERLLIAAAVAAVALAVAALLQRRTRRPDTPTAGRAAVPQQVDRADFVSPQRPWLVVLFSSATCMSCAQARAELEGIDAADVAVQEAEEHRDRDLHQRYGVDTVPIVLIADPDGVTRREWLGPPPRGAVARALHELRHPT